MWRRFAALEQSGRLSFSIIYFLKQTKTSRKDTVSNWFSAVLCHKFGVWVSPRAILKLFAGLRSFGGDDTKDKEPANDLLIEHKLDLNSNYNFFRFRESPSRCGLDIRYSGSSLLTQSAMLPSHRTML